MFKKIHWTDYLAVATVIFLLAVALFSEDKRTPLLGLLEFVLAYGIAIFIIKVMTKRNPPE